MASQDDLLLGTLDGGEEFGIVSFLELLAGLDTLVNLVIHSWDVVRQR